MLQATTDATLCFTADAGRMATPSAHLFTKWGEDYAARVVKGMPFKVRVKPGYAETSVPLWKVPSLV
jgi:hypothetical protein